MSPAALGSLALTRRPFDGPSGHRSIDREVKPDTVAKLDVINPRSRVVAGRRGKGVALDRAHPKSQSLVEAQVVDVGGCSGYAYRRPRPLACQVDGSGDQRASDAAASVCWEDGHILDFDLARKLRLGQLQVAENLISADGNKDLASVEVGVQLDGGVLSEFEQRSQLVARAWMLLDADFGNDAQLVTPGDWTGQSKSGGETFHPSPTATSMPVAPPRSSPRGRSTPAGRPARGCCA